MVWLDGLKIEGSNEDVGKIESVLGQARRKLSSIAKFQESLDKKIYFNEGRSQLTVGPFSVSKSDRAIKKKVEYSFEAETIAETND